MEEIKSKSALGIKLSKLKINEEFKVRLEQYPTPSEIVADIVWNAYMNRDIEGKIVLDAGCGNGVFGIGALLLGAKKVYFIDKDDVIELANENYNIMSEKYRLGEAKFCKQDITEFEKKADCVLQNPPFGTKDKHADKVFLKKAFEVSEVTYSMHKLNTQKFIDSISKDNEFKALLILKVLFPIKATHKFHKKKKVDVEVGVWRFSKE